MGLTSTEKLQKMSRFGATYRITLRTIRASPFSKTYDNSEIYNPHMVMCDHVRTAPASEGTRHILAVLAELFPTSNNHASNSE